MLIRKIKIPISILILLALSVVLNVLRVFIFDNVYFLYLFWNIFLGFIPLLISSILLIYADKDNIIKPVFIVGFVLWILFLPNAPYVITDFIHLGRIHGVPVMYDIFVLFSSAWVSLLMGLHSLSHMEEIFLLRFSKRVTNVIITLSIFVASFGIYLGRFLRFNSWDFFTDHSFLIFSVWKVFAQTNDYINVYAYTALFFAFFYSSFIYFKYSSKKL